MNIMSKRRNIDESKRRPTASGMAIVKRVCSDVGPVEKIVSETDDRVRQLLENQSETKVSLGELKKNYKSFTYPMVHKTAASEMRGPSSLHDYEKVIGSDLQATSLRESGLNDEEIALWIRHQTGISTSSTLHNPEVFQSRLADIATKLREHEERVNAMTGFSGAQIVSRQKLELDKALNQGRHGKVSLSAAVMRLAPPSHDDRSPISQLSKMSDDLSNRLLPRKDPGPAFPHPWTSVNERLQPEQGFIGPKMKDNDLEVSDDYLFKNRLTVDEIRQLPKFSNYQSGAPNPRLFLKNIGSTVKLEHLEHLLERFNIPGAPAITCQLMTGRMNGQAFVQCPDIETSGRVLNAVNGYILRGRPLIILYSKPKS